MLIKIIKKKKKYKNIQYFFSLLIVLVFNFSFLIVQGEDTSLQNIQIKNIKAASTPVSKEGNGLTEVPKVTVKTVTTKTKKNVEKPDFISSIIKTIQNYFNSSTQKPKKVITRNLSKPKVIKNVDKKTPISKSSVIPSESMIKSDPSIPKSFIKKFNEVETNKTPIQDITLDESTEITTKIYKSTDKSTSFLEDDESNEATTEKEIITKDELLGKIKKRTAQNIYFENGSQRPRNIFLPWIVLVILILIVSFIYRFLKENKV